MKRIALVTLLALIGSACNREPSSTPPTTSTPPVADPWQAKPEPPPQVLPKPLLWSITKDGKTSYAFGTMHVGIDPERLPKIVWDKLESKPAFAMETDTSDPAILGLGRRSSGSIHEDLGPEYYKKLEELLGETMVRNVDRMKPVIPAVMLSMKGLPMTAIAMDAALATRAQSKNKQIIYLEPASKQATLLDRWMDVRTLKLLIDTADKSLELTKGMVAAYAAGDADKLLALNDSQKPEALAHGYTEAEYDKQNDEMLYDRNASWIDAIEQMHAKGGGFIAVGALHLIGKKSVLDLLAAKGYTVTRVVQ